ncbi:LysM peptidoglycan-binding domain-containing protein [Iamia majanohamensis]|uniref:LysM peptidoglycan-binding domain-containing protein n=1 Tax=Iamia majanohamensis TaxID=467976 RepID=A0AAE9YB94_9ACTN|nr:BTAD domain-containing putative transcriptional regulator [Iamia majanohamensis]WCO67953.1 LysM peptidoglycan-binding domain-containing protein [Iamia majanohamensis]
MTERRATRLLRGIASLATTLALVVGVPVMLVSLVGWPLPTSLPSLGDLENASRSGISDQVVVNTLAVIAWLVWSQLALSLVVESVAVARGHQAVRVPVLPGLQATAARLVAGILMIGATFQPARAHASPPPMPVVIEETVDYTVAAEESRLVNANGHALELTEHADEPTTTPAVDHPTATVQRHDSYWAIAERTLGDGLRWREIFDLNVGRTLPDGSTIIAGDDTLHTGWVLLLPADATGDHGDAEDPGHEVAADRAASTVVVEPGDNLWVISKRHLEADLDREATDAEVAVHWREVIDANRGRYVQPGNPSLILPGQVIDLAPTGHEPPAPPVDAEPAPDSEIIPDPVEPPSPDDAEEVVPEPPAPSTTVAPPAKSEEPSASPTATDPADEEGSTNALPVAVAVGGLSSIALAVGLKRLIDRRRRRYVDDHDGALPGPTPPDQRERHQAIVAQADEDRIDDLQGTLGRLATVLAAASSPQRPRMVRHADDSLEVLLDQPDTDPPPGWTSSDDGTVWTLTEIPDPDDLYYGPLSPAPLMVTIGQPEDDAQLYLDLEADGLTALTGDQAIAMDLARSILTELTLSPLAETLRVIGVGDVVDEDAKVLEHLTVVDSWEGIVEDVEAWASQSHETLLDQRWPNAFIARGHAPDHDALVPVAVIADRPPPSRLAEVLRTNQPSTVAVVVVGDFEEAVASLRCESDTLNFDMVDLACTPQALDRDELADLTRLVVAADSPEEQLVMEALLDEHETSGQVSDPTPSANEVGGDGPQVERDEPPAFDVLVRLLGDITVEGDRPLKPKATAVVAYIALNRSVTTERLEEACWFGSDGVSHVKRLHDTMTEARGAIGSQHLPANRNGAYAAGPRLRTDVEIFDWHVHRAADLEPAEALVHYRAALDLVSGKPFTYPNAARNSYGWVDFEHHATTWEHRVAGTAQACAAMHIDVAEPTEAIALLGRILEVLPLNSAVVESLMRAHLAQDDRVAADSVYREHAAALVQAKLGDPADSIEQVRLDVRTR